jgi:hypothetical protein
MCDKTCDAFEGTIEHMSGQRHTSEATCPTCGNDEAIVRVRGNAFSSVCTGCRRADVSPLLDGIDLVLTEGETMDAELFELAAARMGCATALVGTAPNEKPPPWSQQVIDDNTGALQPAFDVDFAAAVDRVLDAPAFSVSMRLPVPPR